MRARERRGRPYGVLVGLWFFAFVFLKGGAEGRSNVYSLSFFRFVMPAFPAFVLLACAVVFCVPGLARRWRPARRTLPLRWTRGLVAAAVALAAYPLAVVAVARAAPPERIAKDNADNLLVPISPRLRPAISSAGGRTVLRWRTVPTGGTAVSYVVYRARGDGCTLRTQGARDCNFAMPLAAVVERTTWTDERPGRWTYRVGVVADPLARPRSGDLLLLSPPARSD